MPPLADKAFLAFSLPLAAASFLTTFSNLSPAAIAGAAVGLLVLILFFSVVGKMLRNDPAESWRVALVFGLASGVLSVILAFWGKIADPFAILAITVVAALRGPGYLHEQINKRKDK